jgi:endonuclease YncB( thermonuclease family)
MKKTWLVGFLALSLLAGGLAGCNKNDNSGTQCSSLADPNDLIATPITDALAFPYASDYATKDFDEPTSGLAYGMATLVSNTDGDTANFYTFKHNLVKVRFLGINTPESTAKVEPWGVKASKFTAGKLNAAKHICLVNDIDIFEKYDSSGGRNLGFVWYQADETAAWRLLNLEIVEECYSKNLLFKDSSKLNYQESFTKAGDAGASCGYRVYGTNDPGYDYSSDVVEATVYAVRADYKDLGIDKDAGNSGKELHLKALVVGMIGDNMVLRDIVRDLRQEPTDPYSTIYAYAGYSTGLGSWVNVGDVVYFYCRATIYNGNYQLSDTKAATSGNYAFKVLASVGDSNYGDYVAADNSIDPIIPSAAPTTTDELSKLNGFYTQLDVTVRNITTGDRDDDGNIIPGTGTTTYYNKGKTGETIYAYLAGTTTPCNLRIDLSSNPLLSEKNFAVGTSYRVKAYLAAYYTSYQLQLFNNVKKYAYVTAL